MFDFDLPESLDWRDARIPKPGKPGEFRKIAIPNPELMALQRDLLSNYLTRTEGLMASPFAHGFVNGRSTITGVRRLNRNAPVILRMDAKDFFDNFPVEEVRRRMVAQGERALLVDKLLVACTYRGRLPQGGPCSPFLTNVGMYETDCCLAAYAKKHGFSYIRYADDLVFAMEGSVDDPMNDPEVYAVEDDETGKTLFRPRRYGWFFRGVSEILGARLGIRLNRKKNKVIRLHGRCPRRVLGVVIRKDGAGYNAPRAMRRMARAMLCNLYRKVMAQGGVAVPGDHLKWMQVRGYAAYFDGLRYGGYGDAGRADPVLQEKFWNYLEVRLGNGKQG